MHSNRLNNNLSILPQLELADFADVASRSCKSVFNNRLDGEASDQPASAASKQAALAAGLEYRHIPVVPGKITPVAVAAFRVAQQQLAKTVIAFCRTGKRAATLWALSQNNPSKRASMLQSCAAAGHDLSEIAQ